MKITTLKFILLDILMTSPIWMSAKQKTNFVFIIADDIGWNDVGCYGNRVVKTPHIDHLASEGLQFTNAFLTASSCSPSRCSIISGRYPHSNGVAELHTELPASEIPFPLLLKRNNAWVYLVKCLSEM